MIQKSQDRFHFIDYLRAFVVILVVVDHVAMAYAFRFGDVWFLKDSDRGTFYDVLHLIIDAFHMPILFLLAGMFVVPSLSRRGVVNFMKERWIKLGIPFVIGISTLVPFMTYPKYLWKGGDLGFFDYLSDKFFTVEWRVSDWFEFTYPALTGDIGPAGFWFLYFLMMLTVIAVIVWKIAPFLVHWIGVAVGWLMQHPLQGYLIVSVLCTLAISISELYWGHRFWAGFWVLFYARGNLFMLYIIYFIFGIGLREAGYLDRRDWLEALSRNWLYWTLFAVGLGSVYCWYCLAYYDEGAFSFDILLHFYRGGDWASALPILKEVGPMIWVRTTLHGFFFTAETIALFALFYRFLNRESKIWMALVAGSFGVYIFHESLCVPWVYYLIESDMPRMFKFLLVTIGGYAICWVFVVKICFKIPWMRRVIG